MEKVLLALFLGAIIILFAGCPGPTPAPTPVPVPSTPYTITGSVEVLNDCSGIQADIPEIAKIKTRLEGPNGTFVETSKKVDLAPNPANPNNPIKVGTYSITVQWPPGQGTPTTWKRPTVVTLAGKDVCSEIPCEDAMCEDRSTAANIPVAGPQTNAAVRASCTCVSN